MQDIAGCRIVVPGLVEQDDAVADIQAAFQVLRTDDLREEPHSGYRAVHVIVTARNRHHVEIQVRTQLQDVYAELVEQMADTFGIDLKYGGGGTVTRAVLAASAQRAYELDVMKQTLVVLQDVRPESDQAEIRELRDKVVRAEERHRSATSAIIERLGHQRERSK